LCYTKFTLHMSCCTKFWLCFFTIVLYLERRLKARDYRQRSVTAILYLNDQNWDSAQDADGGALICYTEAEAADVTGSTSPSVLRVNPRGGTLVLFDSRYLLHAVAPSNTIRYALAIWITGEPVWTIIHDSFVNFLFINWPNKHLTTCHTHLVTGLQLVITT
jgi:hypothetical protein